MQPRDQGSVCSALESVSRIALLEGSAAAKSLVLIVLIDESTA